VVRPAKQKKRKILPATTTVRSWCHPWSMVDCYESRSRVLIVAALHSPPFSSSTSRLSLFTSLFLSVNPPFLNLQFLPYFFSFSLKIFPFALIFLFLEQISSLFTISSPSSSHFQSSSITVFVDLKFLHFFTQILHFPFSYLILNVFGPISHNFFTSVATIKR